MPGLWLYMQRLYNLFDNVNFINDCFRKYLHVFTFEKETIRFLFLQFSFDRKSKFIIDFNIRTNFIPPTDVVLSIVIVSFSERTLLPTIWPYMIVHSGKSITSIKNIIKFDVYGNNSLVTSNINCNNSTLIGSGVIKLLLINCPSFRMETKITFRETLSI